MELAGGAFLDGAPSAELTALLEGIADISTDSVPKFTPATRQALTGLIVGRAYAPPLLELCHLLRVAALAPRRRFELFFWGVDLARAGAYAGWVRTHLRGQPGTAAWPRIEAEAGGVSIAYEDGRFAVSFGRMPLLVALMEFLVSSLGYPAVLERVETLLAGPARLAAAGALANDLSRAVYAWVAPHLPTAHEKRRLEALVAWLLSRSGPRSFATDDIDDETVLTFWLEAEEPEFRTYAAALRGFLLLIDAVEDAAAVTSFARAASLGTDAEAGEIDPAAPDAMGSDAPAGGKAGRVVSAAEVDPGADPLAALAEPPADAIKMLNARERAELEQVLEAGARAERLMLSLLRRAVFGAVQARISEALRRGGNAAAAKVLDTLGREIEAPGYAGWTARYDELGSHIERVMLASLHVLARAGRPEVVHLLVAVGGEGDLASLREDGITDPAQLGARLLDPTIAGPAIAALMLRARRSFQGLSRAGFEPDAAGRPDIVDGHAAAAPQLPRLAARLARARAALARRTPEVWAAQQETDRRLFAGRFSTIYGITMREMSP